MAAVTRVTFRVASHASSIHFISISGIQCEADPFMMNKSNPEASKGMREPVGSVDPDLDNEGPDDDLRLVALAQKGDMHAYDTLVTRHRGRIFAMIRNMIHQEADAWDLAQEVFIKAWQALPRFEA